MARNAACRTGATRAGVLTTACLAFGSAPPERQRPSRRVNPRRGRDAREEDAFRRPSPIQQGRFRRSSQRAKANPARAERLRSKRAGEKSGCGLSERGYHWGLSSPGPSVTLRWPGDLEFSSDQQRSAGAGFQSGPSTNKAFCFHRWEAARRRARRRVIGC